MRVFFFIVGIFIQYSNGYSLTLPLNDLPIVLKSVSCADGNSSCPSHETCCEYGCCPLSNAICCNDHLHCCPNGYTCDVEHSRCAKDLGQSRDVICPGDGISCVDGETCCQSEPGDSGCCPLPDAVCCNDSSHCCPHGYTCNVKESKCEKGILSIPWFTKKTGKSLDVQFITSSSSSDSAVQCAVEKSFCLEDTTCCEYSNSSYGCCPYRRGTCCSDKIHCCGEEYSCDESASKCIRQLSLTPLSIIDEQTCPDGITKCSLSSTCCPNKDKNNEITYSCCPFAQGVCCGSNGTLCCPYKYTCDEEHLSCQLKETIFIEDGPLGCMPGVTLCTAFQSRDIFSLVSPGPLDICSGGRVCCSSGSCCLDCSKCLVMRGCSNATV